MKFHHRHLPNFIRWGKAGFQKWMHLHFPIVIHVTTDTYHQRHHHLAIDIVYSVLTFVLIAANVGLGIWYVLYFQPPDLDVRVLTNSTVVSGESMEISMFSLNPHRQLDGATIDVYLPRGFIADATKTGGDVVHFELGARDRFATSTVSVRGVVFGDVGSSYDVRVVTTTRSFYRTQYETTVHTFTVIDSLFDIEIAFPEAATYDVPFRWTISYQNRGEQDLEGVTFDLEAPEAFLMQSITTDGATQTAEPHQRKITLGTIPKDAEGSMTFTSIFESPREDQAAGDQQVEIAVLTSSRISEQETASVAEFSHGRARSTLQVLLPRVVATMTGESVVNFGDTIHADVVVRNVTESPVQNVELQAHVLGTPVSADELISNGTSLVQTDESVRLPIIDRLLPSEEKTFRLEIPTHATNERQVSSSLFITGVASLEGLDTPFSIVPASLETKYHSMVNLSAEAVYFGPSGEQIGYGPYPPKARETTALRVILQLQNVNNPLSDVAVEITLPNEVEWTDSFSVSAGTTMEWNNDTRTVTWKIDSLPPRSDAYGAQFEIRFTPNETDVGQQFILVDTVSVTAFDEYTKARLTTSADPVKSPEIL